MGELILPDRFSGKQKNKKLELPDNIDEGTSSEPPFTEQEIVNALNEHELNLANMILSFVAEHGLKSVVMHYRFFGQELENGQWTASYNRTGEFSHGPLDPEIFSE